MAAPSGGGGGGGPVGFSNSFTGAAQALELVGDHCYAYSGELTTTANTPLTFLEFTTGNYYSVVNVQFNYSQDYNDDATYRILMNGTLIQQWMSTGSTNPHQPQNLVPIVIPPYTEIVVSAFNKDNGRPQIVSLTGRIYRQ